MKVLSIRAAADMAGISVSTLKRLMAGGAFPHKFQITERRIGFLESEVSAWISERVAERDATPEGEAA